MNTLNKVARFYLASLDTTVRIFGGYFIVALIYGALFGALSGMNWLLSGNFSEGPLHLWLGLILTPPILRLGVFAAGFSIPPIMKRRKKTKKGPLYGGGDEQVTTADLDRSVDSSPGDSGTRENPATNRLGKA